MLKLAEKYGDRTEKEFPLLFQRILQNNIRDFHRRSRVRNLWTTLLSSLGTDESEDPLETLPADNPSLLANRPDDALQQSHTLAAIEEAISLLPPRQREAFLMRYWEEMDISETAAAMDCSEGSVKTHCSRAVRALAASLSAKGIHA